MTDIVDKSTRSRMMAGIRGKDTKPERLLRSLLHRAGFRFRLHSKELPGKPDIVLPRYNTAIFVHGCFWHRHADCHYAAMPATRPDFWEAKFAGNMGRDLRILAAVVDAGWRILTVWECGLKHDPDKVLRETIAFLTETGTKVLSLPAEPARIRDSEADVNT